MPLRSKLTVKQGQRLVMTPSLQNSLRILQLNHFELKTELQGLLQSNIMLEVDSDLSLEESRDDFEHDEGITEEELLDFDEMDTTVEMEEYDDYFNQDHSTSLSRNNDMEDYDPLNQLTDTHRATTHDDLMWQLTLNELNDAERLIGEVIIREIDDEGFLKTALKDIVKMLDDLLTGLTEADVENVLTIIQQFDPPGIAARSIEESMVIQIQQLTPKPAWADDAVIILTEGVDDLIRMNFKALSRLLGKEEAEIRLILAELQYLNPRPGYKIGGSDVAGIEPDLIVTMEEDKLIVSLNESIMPKLRINPFYKGLLRKMQEKDGMMSEHLAEARNVIRNIGSRFDTLLMVGREVVEYQKAYFFEGDRALRPLQLKDIAEKLDFNESTISRAVAGKYILCPTGMLELSFFFSNQVGSSSTSDGEDASAVAIRAILQSIIDNENPEKPYSDSKLAALLEEKGHKVARRTIAKYREVLNIPSSTNRRSLAR